MNHKSVTFAIASIMATIAAISVGFVVPEQALAYYHHHHHNTGIKVDQQINQLNACSLSICDNEGNNTADIDR